MLATCAIALIALLQTCVHGNAVASEPGLLPGRDLLQAGKTTKVRVQGLPAFLKELETVKNGTVLIIEGDLKLSQPVVVDAAITLKGAAPKRKTTISCTQENTALVLSGDGIVLENLTIRGCGAPAVHIINPLTSNTQQRAPIAKTTLSEMDFFDNKIGEFDVFVDGAAVRVDKDMNVTVSDCLFQGNIASSGGAIVVDHGDLLVENSVFRDNIAIKSSGGAIHAEDKTLTLIQQDPDKFKTLTIRDSLFEGNMAQPQGISFDIERINGGSLEVSRTYEFKKPALSGGAIFSVTHKVEVSDSVFKGNVATAGGAMFLKDNDEIFITNCEFRDQYLNSILQDVEQGGALYIFSTKDELKVKIAGSSFRNNTGILGGALHILVPYRNSDVTIQDTVFEKNMAQSSGGAALVRNGDAVTWTNCTFIGNSAQSGGAMMLTNGGGSRFTAWGADTGRCQFFDNMAMDGGAVHCLGAGTTEFLNIHAKGNRALRNGGALALINSVAGATKMINHGIYEENIAYRGGGVYSDGIVELDIRPALPPLVVFRNNVASTGGGLFISVRNPESNEITISAEFINNHAKKDYEFDQSFMEHLALTVKDIPQQEDRFQMVDIDQSDVTGCGRGGGGGVCLGLVSVPERALVKVLFLNSLFKGNKASNGGGLNTRSITGRWSPGCALSETPISYKRCRSFSLVGCSFLDNTVDGAGGSIFTTHPSDVFVECERHTVGNFVNGDKKSLSSMAPPLCKNWTGEIMGKEGYGGVVASVASELSLVKVPSGLKNHTSGKALPSIRLEVHDAFGQVITGGISDSNLSVSARSTAVRGQLDATARKGVATFDSLVVSATPGDYKVSFDGQDLKPVEIDVTIRQCFTGEEIICPGEPDCDWGEHTGCQLCEKEFYSFNPNISCVSCPQNADCPGGAAMIPRPGFWHSTPFSPIIHECLVEEACSYGDRQKNLSRFYEQRENLMVAAVMDEEYKQCRPGYSGPLCGSCEYTFGRMERGECAECNADRGESIAIISTIAFWAVLLVAIGIRSALNTTRDLQDMQAVEALRMQNADGNPPQAPSPTPYQDNPPGLNLTMKGSLSHGSSPSQGSRIGLIDPPADLGLEIAPSETHDIDHITASENVSEAVKILVNFLQVTSIAVAINVEWTNFIKRLLEAQDIAAGFSNGSGVVSIDCVLPKDTPIPRSVISLILRISFPFVILAIMLLFFFLYWVYMWNKNGKSFKYFVSRAIISALCILFFTYALITKDLMRSVNCIPVDSDDDSGQLYHEYAIARDKYWGEDTSLTCFEGTHGFLVFALGLPGLALISFGAPVYLAYFLNKNKARLNDRDFLNTYGFAYQAYKEKNVYWDAVIMARKGLIGAVVVFAYPLGGNLQGVLALGVLLLALVLHMLIQPFRNTKLNYLEAASLVVSALTFYSGIVFNDPKTSTEAEVAVSIILFAIIIVFVVAAAFQVYYNLDLYMYARLGHLEVSGLSESWGFFKKMTKLAFAELPLDETGEVVANIKRNFTKKVGGKMKRVLSRSRLSGESEESNANSSCSSSSPRSPGSPDLTVIGIDGNLSRT
ncbi:hypothetical protein BSKO_05282 [Bryopsis sp. KO-2023]|nr:hypothetical protein BSKO_05282 [Bryopsis sp. KO-2023]